MVHTVPTITLSAFLFFNDTATPEIYTLSLHDALPISGGHRLNAPPAETPARPIRIPARRDAAPTARTDPHSIRQPAPRGPDREALSIWSSGHLDRKSTRLNSSHTVISYAVFCLQTVIA